MVGWNIRLKQPLVLLCQHSSQNMRNGSDVLKLHNCDVGRLNCWLITPNFSFRETKTMQIPGMGLRRFIVGQEAYGGESFPSKDSCSPPPLTHHLPFQHGCTAEGLVGGKIGLGWKFQLVSFLFPPSVDQLLLGNWWQARDDNILFSHHCCPVTNAEGTSLTWS